MEKNGPMGLNRKQNGESDVTSFSCSAIARCSATRSPSRLLLRLSILRVCEKIMNEWLKSKQSGESDITLFLCSASARDTAP